MISGEFYTLGEAARHLGKGRTTLWRWLKKGKLTGQRVGNLVLIKKEDVEALLHQRGEV